jgi:hypothetical protein
MNMLSILRIGHWDKVQSIPAHSNQVVLDYKVKKRIILTVYQTNTHVKSKREERARRAKPCVKKTMQLL